MGKKKPIVTPFGQWAYPGEITIIPSNNITMKGVDYPVMGIDNLGNSELMLPGQDYTFPGDYVTEIPQMGKGGLTQWFAEEWTDVKTGKTCGRSGKEKGSRPYPACRPKKRVNETTPKTTSEMSSAEKAKFKREKTSGKRIDYNHKRRQKGGEQWYTTQEWEDAMPDSTFENIVEFLDPSGVLSYDDARRAYREWKESKSSLPTTTQALDMFGAVPALGKFGKLKYLAEPARGVINLSKKSIYKYFPWQDVLNAVDTAQDEYDKKKGGQTGWLDSYQDGGETSTEQNPVRIASVNVKAEDNLFKDLRSGYNKFRTNLYKYMGKNPAFMTSYLGTKAVLNKTGDILTKSVGTVLPKRFIFDKVRPVDYPESNPLLFAADATLRYIGKGAKPLRDSSGNYVPGEEIYRKILGFDDSSYNYIENSPYKPSKVKDQENSEYIKFKNLYDPQKLINAYVKAQKNLPEGKTSTVIPSLDPYIINRKNIEASGLAFSQQDPLQNFTLDKGKDEKGTYISLYDKYDFSGPANNLLYGFRKPLEIYDRFYYEKNKQGSPIYKKKKYGGWLDQYQSGGETSTEQNPTRIAPVDIRVKRKKVSDSNRYMYDTKGNLVYNPSLDIYPLIAEDSTEEETTFQPNLPVDLLNPTLEELVNVAGPYYPIDNRLASGDRINLPASDLQRSLEQDYILPQMVGRSFGNLPLNRGNDIDDGYGPSRRWTTNLNGHPGNYFIHSPETYAYILKADKSSLVDFDKKRQVESGMSNLDQRFNEALATQGYNYEMVDDYAANRPNQIWNRAEQARVEMLNNPEIREWARLHNLDLSNKYRDKYDKEVAATETDDGFASKIPESVYANRLVKAGLPTSRPDYDYRNIKTFIIQDPSKFNLAGYFPIDQEMINSYVNTGSYENLKKIMAERMGIDPAKFDTGEYLIHYNRSPISEYTPGMKNGGWLNKYK